MSLYTAAPRIESPIRPIPALIAVSVIVLSLIGINAGTALAEQGLDTVNEPNLGVPIPNGLEANCPDQTAATSPPVISMMITLLGRSFDSCYHTVACEAARAYGYTTFLNQSWTFGSDDMRGVALQNTTPSDSCSINGGGSASISVINNAWAGVPWSIGPTFGSYAGWSTGAIPGTRIAGLGTRARLVSHDDTSGAQGVRSSGFLAGTDPAVASDTTCCDPDEGAFLRCGGIGLYGVQTRDFESDASGRYSYSSDCDLNYMGGAGFKWSTGPGVGSIFGQNNVSLSMGIGCAGADPSHLASWICPTAAAGWVSAVTDWIDVTYRDLDPPTAMLITDPDPSLCLPTTGAVVKNGFKVCLLPYDNTGIKRVTIVIDPGTAREVRFVPRNYSALCDWRYRAPCPNSTMPAGISVPGSWRAADTTFTVDVSNRAIYPEGSVHTCMVILSSAGDTAGAGVPCSFVIQTGTCNGPGAGPIGGICDDDPSTAISPTPPSPDAGPGVSPTVAVPLPPPPLPAIFTYSLLSSGARISNNQDPTACQARTSNGPFARTDQLNQITSVKINLQAFLGTKSYSEQHIGNAFSLRSRQADDYLYALGCAR